MARQKNKSLLSKNLEQKKVPTGRIESLLEPVNKQDRQESLKQVLKETMNLTMTLKGQLAILERKGIHNKVVQPKQKKIQSGSKPQIGTSKPPSTINA